jgi:flagellar protein FliS
MSQPANAYRQLSVESATPLGLVVMLYDGAIAAMQRAATAIEARDVQTKCDQLNRALAIIAQLEGTLNFELGGAVAQTLKTLYVHARAQALKANIEDSPQILRALIDNFTTVREAWSEADRRPSDSPATAASEAISDPPSPANFDIETSPYAPAPPLPADGAPYGASPATAANEAVPAVPSPATRGRGRSPYGASTDPECGSWRVAA